MTLGEFKKYIESLPDNKEFNYSISDPFSWRGSYDEVCFFIEETPSSKADFLDKIDQSLTLTFHGYKGGEYKYKEYTKINFEEKYSDWSDGKYTEEWISKLLDIEKVESAEERLVKLLTK